MVNVSINMAYIRILWEYLHIFFQQFTTRALAHHYSHLSGVPLRVHDLRARREEGLLELFVDLAAG